MDSPSTAAELLQELRDFGVKIYLDDFGTGYSSLSHLHKLPVDALKIDRSFVRSLLLPDRPAIVESILALARTLNTSVVAEGIESEVQARELERLGCTHAQGFLFSRPIRAAPRKSCSPRTSRSARRRSTNTASRSRSVCHETTKKRAERKARKGRKEECFKRRVLCTGSEGAYDCRAMLDQTDRHLRPGLRRRLPSHRTPRRKTRTGRDRSRPFASSAISTGSAATISRLI